MIINATFWVAVSFFIFIGIIFYFKIPQKVYQSLEETIKKIKKEIDDAETLKDEAKNLLSDYETKTSKVKNEANLLIQKAKEEAKTNMIKLNEEYHNSMENRKKIAEQKIRQLKMQSIKDIKNFAINVAIISTEKIIKNSIDKKKLDKIYISSIEEAKKILKNKSI